MRPTNKPDGKEKPSQNSEMEGKRVRIIKPPRNKRFDSSASTKHHTRAQKAEAKTSCAPKPSPRSHSQRGVSDKTKTERERKKRKGPNPALNHQQAPLGTERKERPPAKRPKEHKLHRQNNQGCRRRARTIEQENAGPGRERSP